MKHKNLVYLSFAHPTAALAALDKLPTDCEVIEFGQLHAGHITVFVSCASNILAGGILDATDGIYLESPKPELMKGYFKQLNTQVKKNLLVLEAAHLSHVLTTVDGLLKKSSYQLIEISRAQGAQTHAVAYLANGAIEDALMPASQDLMVRLFEEPSGHVLKMFNI